jgi:glucosylceramidase
MIDFAARETSEVDVTFSAKYSRVIARSRTAGFGWLPRPALQALFLASRRCVIRLVPCLFLLSVALVVTPGCSDSNHDGMSGVAPDNQVEVWITLGDESKKLQQERDLSWESGASDSGAAIAVDGTTLYQKMEGFGAAMTDSSAWLIMNKLDDNQRQQLMRDLFTREGDGIGLSFVRLPMGASDFALQNYTYNDLPPGETDPDLLNFSIAYDAAYIIPSLQLARDLNPQLLLMGSPWSPPAWMKNTGSVNGGILLPEFYQAFANYHVKFVQAYADANLAIDAVTPQNEPMNWNPFYPTMVMLSSHQQTFIRDYLGPAFRDAELGTRIIMLDHNWDLTDYVLEVLSDPAAAEYIDGVGFHCYIGDVASQSIVHDAHPDKGIWFTECSGGGWATDFGDNLSWAMRNLVIGNFRNWGNSLQFWNLALDQNDGPKNGSGCENCRGVVTIDQATGGVTYNEEYYTLGHVSKFVDPGAYRIESTSDGDATPRQVAFLNPDGSMVLIIEWDAATTFSVNWNGQHFNYSLPSPGAVTFKWSTDLRPDVDKG